MSKVSSGAVTVSKNHLESIVVQKQRYKGKPYVDARLWVLDIEGEPETATRKGLCLSPELWRRLLPAIAEAVSEHPAHGDEPQEAET